MKSLLILITSTLLSSAEQRPNILMILADDMGYGDLGCMGSEVIKTPHIDALAEKGILFTQAYVPSAVCSPSRAGILTGRDPRRFGYEHNLNKKGDHYATRHELQGLPTNEHTIADHLKAAEYETALIGKWHLGHGLKFHPNQRGFDHFFGMINGNHSYFLNPKNHHLEQNGKPLKSFTSGYITDAFTDEAIRWINSRGKETPWFLFASYNAPHTPLHATKEDLALFQSIQNPKRRTYAAMMHALDRGVGRLTKNLADQGQLENTLIVFFSDNGGATNNGSWNGPLAGRKGSLREGGIRVPLIVHWPAKIPTSFKSEQVVSALDLLPTFLEAAGQKPLPLQQAPPHEDKRNRHKAEKLYGDYDGSSLFPFFKNHSETTDRLLFWRLQGQSGVLAGDYKLIKLSHRPAELYRPASDPAEINNLAQSNDEKLRQLFLKLGEWEGSHATIPLWGSSPFWDVDSAKIYDTRAIQEPR